MSKNIFFVLDERRPTVNELSNQKGVAQKASGWKLFHMAAQIEDLVSVTVLVDLCSGFKCYSVC